MLVFCRVDKLLQQFGFGGIVGDEKYRFTHGVPS